MKNSFILLALFIALNVDVAAVWLYSKYPHIFEADTVQQIEPEITEISEEPISPTETIIEVDIIVEEPVVDGVLENVMENEPVNIDDPDTDMVEEKEAAPQAEERLLPKRIPANYMLTDKSNFRQDERGWAYDPLGHTNQTMREFGCTVTSVANAITNYDQDFVTPRILNQNLIKARGFTDRGWLKWSAISTATDGKYSARVFNSASHANIDSCMANNEYPVVKIFLRGEVQHWVLIVGKRNGEYLIRDPLEGDRADHPIPLSSRAKGVHSLRCIKKN
ncbi:MAG: hypothetical protein EX271_04050 [Acidimicrobiales bacterium]|nr:hypothetical protein [Hyphomonadaceae bacterium]RZV43336.1 MAG: hypothetical protein EX271_04050 [Acidimicrobiales bacterium]